MQAFSVKLKMALFDVPGCPGNSFRKAQNMCSYVKSIGVQVPDDKYCWNIHNCQFKMQDEDLLMDRMQVPKGDVSSWIEKWDTGKLSCHFWIEACSVVFERGRSTNDNLVLAFPGVYLHDFSRVLAFRTVPKPNSNKFYLFPLSFYNEK
jgi:hypothetical protein